MNAKAKGTAAERELIHMFWAAKWAAFRAAGSGSVKYPVPDLIAGNSLRKLAIEVKSTKDSKQYLTPNDVDQILTFAHLFGAEPWFAIRFAQRSWFFINPEDLKETKQNFVINRKNAELKGLSFQEIIEGF